MHVFGKRLRRKVNLGLLDDERPIKISNVFFLKPTCQI